MSRSDFGRALVTRVLPAMLAVLIFYAPVAGAQTPGVGIVTGTGEQPRAVELKDHAGVDSGLALTPPMGWNSWNRFACNIDEKLIRETADAIASSGMRDAGYQYVAIDDCWHGERHAHGDIQPDPRRFPSGIKEHKDVGDAHGSITATAIPAHGVVMLTLHLISISAGNNAAHKTTPSAL